LKGTGDNYIRERELIKIYTMSNKVIYAIYNDDDILMDAVKKPEQLIIISKKFYSISVHGLDKAMGLAPTRLAICAFIYGCVGISVYHLDDELYYDSRLAQDIGGKKPSFSYIENMPAICAYYV
jgi:hypothetical protein